MTSKEASKQKNVHDSSFDGIFYENLLNKITEALLVIDEAKTIRFVNSACEQLFNKSRQDITNEPLEKFLPDLNHDEVCISVQNSPDKTCRLNREKVKWGESPAVVLTLQDITDYKKTEKLLSKHTSALTERVKELNALYEISKLTANKKIDTAEVLQETTNILTKSWQFPAITQAKICWSDKCFKSKNYQAKAFRQSADIMVNDVKSGSIEVGYQKEMPHADEGPFLKEERKLIDNVAEKLGKYLAHEADRKEIEFHSKLLNAIGEAVIYTDLEGTIQYWNNAAEKIYGWKKEEVLGNKLLEYLPAESMKGEGEFIVKEILKGRTWTGESTVKSKDGKRRDIMLSNAPFLDTSNKVNGIIGVSRDITEHKNAEKSSKDFAERLNNVAKNLPGAIYQYKITPDGKISLPFISGDTKDIYNHSSQELMNKPELAYELVHPEDKKRYKEEIQKSLKNLSPYHSVFRIIHPEGKTNWVEVKSIPKRDKSGDVIWTGVLMNVTRIKKTEQLLHQSEQMFNDVAENLPGMVYQFKMNNEGNFILTYVSKSAERLLKRDIKGLDSEALFAMVHPDDLESIMRAARESAKDLSYWTGEFRIKTYEGEYRWIQGKTLPRRQADMSTVWNGVMIDITEKKNAEIKNRESEEKLREAQEIANLGNFELDLQTRKTIWSDEIFKLLELNYSTESHDLGDFKNIVDKKDQWKINHYINKTVSTKKQESFDIKILLPGSRSKHLQIIGKPLINGNDEVKQIRGTVMDITDRKMHEIELGQAKEKAEESDRLKSVFLQTMSHELRTPLNAIIGFSDLMVSEQLDEEQQEEFITLINNSGKHLLSIIEDLFEISALETGQSKLKFEEIKISTFFDDLIPIIEDHRQRINKQHLELVFTPDRNYSEVAITSDKSKIARVIRNLLYNALKFTKQGKIEFGYTVQGKDLMFFVRDTGIGIPEDKHQLIFERFRQAEESPTRNFEGVGLGLSICKIIAEMLDAKIWVDSTEGKGSTFYFKLKKVLENVIPKDTGQNPVNNDDELQKGKNILVVEDEQTNMQLIEIILKREGLNVIKAINGREAVEIFQSNPSIDIVLMDLKMPILNGFDATREIRKLNNKVPVIALTAYALEGDRQKAFQAGCVGYISKPLNREALIQLIEKHLGN